MGQEYTYYGVQVEPAFDDRLFYYLADTNYSVDDYVVVPFGSRQLLGIIGEVKHCSAEDAPYSPKKAKKIIRKATDDDIRGGPEPGKVDNTDDSSWTGKTPPRVICNGQSIEVSPLELKIIQWIKDDQSPRPLRDVQCRYRKYTPKAVEEAMEHLLRLGILYGGKNFVMNTYFPNIENKIRIPGMISTAFAKLEALFKNASQEEIENQAVASASILEQLLQSAGMENSLEAIFIVVKCGIGHEGPLTEREKHLVYVLLGDDGEDDPDADEIFRFLQATSLDGSIEVVKHMLTEDLFGLDALLLTLSFAYIDGEIGDEIAGELDEAASEVILAMAEQLAKVGGNKKNSDTSQKHASEKPTAQHREKTAQKKTSAGEKRKPRDDHKPDSRQPALEVKAEQDEAKKREEEEYRLYEAQMAEWKSKRAEITQKRDEKVKERLAQEEKRLIKYAKERGSQAIERLEKEVRRLEENIRAAEQLLASLGFFKFNEKKEQKAAIEGAQRRLMDAHALLTAEKDKLDYLVNSAGENALSKRSIFRTEAEKEFPFPPKPEKPEFLKKKEEQEKKRRESEPPTHEEQRELIVKCLRKKGSCTLDEIVQSHPQLRKLNPMRLRPVVRELVDEGIVSSDTIRGKVIFSIAQE